MSNIKRNIPRGPITLDELLNQFGNAAIRASRKTLGTPEHRAACREVTKARRRVLDRVDLLKAQQMRTWGQR